MRALRSKLTYANVISSLCLFLVLGGGAAVAAGLGPNSVGTTQLKNGAVTGPKIKRASIEATKLTQLAISTLKGATGPKGAKGAAGAKGATGAKGDTGAKGATGARGETGPIGPVGPIGPAGNPGAFATVVPGTPPTFKGTHPGFTAVELAETGIYCLTPTNGVDVSHPIAAVNWLDSASGESGFSAEPLAGGVAKCKVGTLEVRTTILPKAPEPETTLSDGVSFTVFAPAG